MAQKMKQKAILQLDLQVITRIHGQSQTFHPVRIHVVIGCHGCHVTIATEAIVERCSTKIDDPSKPAMQCSFHYMWSKMLRTTFERVHVK